MEAEAEWQDAGRGSLFHSSILCDMKWSAEKAREARRIDILRKLGSLPTPRARLGNSGASGALAHLKQPRDHVAASLFGGPIAVLSFDDFEQDIYDDFKFDEAANQLSGPELQNSELNGGEDFGPSLCEGKLRLYSSSGELVHCSNWYEGPPAPGGFGWSRGGLLVCVLASGDSAIVVKGLVDRGQDKQVSHRNSKLHNSPPEDDFTGASSLENVKRAEIRVLRIPTNGDENSRRIGCAHVWAGGFVAVTEDLQVIEGLNLSKQSSYRIHVRAQLSPVLLGGMVPKVVTVLRPLFNVESASSAPICVGNPSRAGIVVVESDGQVRSQFAMGGSNIGANSDTKSTAAQTKTMAVSHVLAPHPTLGLIASYGVDGELCVLPLDFCQVLVRHDCQSELERTSADAWRGIRLPSSVVWCGTSTFALAAMWSQDTPWSGKTNSGLLMLSMEHQSALLSRALMYGSNMEEVVPPSQNQTGHDQNGHAGDDDDHEDLTGTGSAINGQYGGEKGKGLDSSFEVGENSERNGGYGVNDTFFESNGLFNNAPVDVPSAMSNISNGGYNSTLRSGSIGGGSGGGSRIGSLSPLSSPRGHPGSPSSLAARASQQQKSKNAGHCARFSFKGRCFAFLEMDGVRVVGLETSCMVRQVPECFRALFRLGSTDPAAMLLDALEMVDNGDADADASLRALVESDNIYRAVETCLDAAEHATCYGVTQQNLIRAASYGKRFFHLSTSGRPARARKHLARRFVDVCNSIKIVTSVLLHAGTAVTNKQLRILTPKVLLDRLLYQGQFYLAQRLCQAAKVSRVHVITHWASAKIRAHSAANAAAAAAELATAVAEESGGSGPRSSPPLTPKSSSKDRQLVEDIVKRVDECFNKFGVRVPFASLAAVAAAVGNRSLALQLGARERKLSRRVLLFLQIQDYESALQAIGDDESGKGCDPDLMLFVASECFKGLPWDEMLRLCRTNASTLSLFSRFLRTTDRNAYKKLLLDLDRKSDKALVLAKESSASLDARRRIALLRESGEEFSRSGNRSVAQLAADHAQLLERQHEISDRLVGLSLANTVLDCVRRGMDDEAEAFATRFGLKERTYRIIQLRGLAARKAWARIEELSYQQAVRAVVDDADFCEAYLKGGRKEEATKHATLLEDSSERKAELLLFLGLYEAAMEAAFNIGNVGALEHVRKRCPMLADQVKSRLETLNKEGPKIKIMGTGKQKGTIINQARETCAQQ